MHLGNTAPVCLLQTKISPVVFVSAPLRRSVLTRSSRFYAIRNVFECHLCLTARHLLSGHLSSHYLSFKKHIHQAIEAVNLLLQSESEILLQTMRTFLITLRQALAQMGLKILIKLNNKEKNPYSDCVLSK